MQIVAAIVLLGWVVVSLYDIWRMSRVWEEQDRRLVEEIKRHRSELAKARMRLEEVTNAVRRP